jgi:hypothetical protein
MAVCSFVLFSLGFFVFVFFFGFISLL